MIRLLAPLLAIALAAALGGLAWGYVPLPPQAVLAGLIGQGDPAVVAVVREVRLPRALLALEVGAALGLAGAAMQGLLRNPLAEPGVMGVSASAGLGAVVALYFGFSAVSPWAMPAFGMLGAGAATAVLLIVALRGAGGLALILTGVALSALATALIALAMNLAPNPYALSEIALWLLGSVKDRSMDQVLLALPCLVLGGLPLLLAARGLDALSLGEDAAASLGINLRRLRLMVIVGMALTVGASVAVAGAVGFVGLVAPHLVRGLVGHRPGRVLLPAAAAGAALVAVADLATRLIPGPQEVMLGVLTALVGTPFFLLLIFRLPRTVGP